MSPPLSLPRINSYFSSSPNIIALMELRRMTGRGCAMFGEGGEGVVGEGLGRGGGGTHVNGYWRLNLKKRLIGINSFRWGLGVGVGTGVGAVVGAGVGAGVGVLMWILNK